MANKPRTGRRPVHHSVCRRPTLMFVVASIVFGGCDSLSESEHKVVGLWLTTPPHESDYGPRSAMILNPDRTWFSIDRPLYGNVETPRDVEYGHRWGLTGSTLVLTRQGAVDFRKTVIGHSAGRLSTAPSPEMLVVYRRAEVEEGLAIRDLLRELHRRNHFPIESQAFEWSQWYPQTQQRLELEGAPDDAWNSDYPDE